jgi:hypothetical protein
MRAARSKTLCSYMFAQAMPVAARCIGWNPCAAIPSARPITISAMIAARNPTGTFVKTGHR